MVKSSYQEKISRIAPQRLVMEHAVGKAEEARVAAKQGLVLGSDTIVYAGGKILGKPKNLAGAYAMLRRISGKAHSVYTGVALKNLKTGQLVKGYAKTKVFVRPLSQNQIENYCRRVPNLDKAGAYAIQMKPKIVRKIEGSYSNVVGLPKELLRKLIREICFEE